MTKVNRVTQIAKNKFALGNSYSDKVLMAMMGKIHHSHYSASYQSLKAEMSAAKQLAAYREISAPFAGVISDRMVSPGALVGANDKPLVALAQQDHLRLTIATPEKHAHALSDSNQDQIQD